MQVCAVCGCTDLRACVDPFDGAPQPEGYVALELGRKFIGVELKRSYFDQACANLASADAQADMFTAIPVSFERIKEA